LAGLALLLSAPSPAGASQQDCSFHLPSFEQHKEYVTRLQNLTLFADCNTEGSYLYYRQWYTDQMPSRRWGSRGLALLVIVLGAILPLVVHIQKVNANYKLWVSLIGALIVIAQGLSQTFAYDAAWRNFMIARMKLEMAQDLWQHEMIKASLDEIDSLARMEGATDAFAKQVAEVVLEETSGFFTELQRASSVRSTQKPDL
jgi:hypothetical protein